MISLDELSEVKEIRKTNLYYEEKEYIQYIFLNALSKYYKNFIFKGGTCLRICFGLERASEDLDFSTNLSIFGVKQVVNKCLEDFRLLNIDFQVYSEKEFKGNLRIEVRFKGPLFSGNQSSTNTLKLDFNKRRVKHKIAKVVPRLFSDVPLFTLFVLDEKEILAEKIRALINRAEPRDLYDVWMLFSKGVKVDKPLLLEKLKEEKSKLSNLRIPQKTEYEQGLKNLVSVVPPYEQVKGDVLNNLKAMNKKRLN